MRRSAAPSQIGEGSAAKRPCFNPPYIANSKNTPAPPVLTAPSQIQARDRSNIFSVMQAPLLDSYVEESPVTNHNESSSSSTSAALDGRRSAMDILSLIEKGSLTKDKSNRIKDNAETGTSNTTNNFLSEASRKASDAVKRSTSLTTPALSSTRPPASATSSVLSSNEKSADHRSSTLNTGSNRVNKADDDDDGHPARYMSVMWAKLSKKKHKKWEGDAILVAKGRTVRLVDMDGKEIARGTGYKTSELETLSDGQMLVIGGKEIEVMGVLSESEYVSGTCFEAGASTVDKTNHQTTTSSETSSSSAPATASSSRIGTPISQHKPFVRPSKDNSALNLPVKMKPDAPLKPMYDPNAPNALVLPRPSDSHQWQHNIGKLAVVDVVVDPHIVQQLRPHQREGVVFLYQCLLGMKACRGYGAILADEMGLGKTLQCIAVLWTMYKQGPYGGKPVIRKTLIITPGSLVKNWSKEFKKWLSSERLNVFAVGPDKKVEDFADSNVSPVLIISYEMFIRSVEVLKKVKFDLLICDEGHRLKNSNIKTSTLVNGMNISRRIVLTGTPLQNDLQELYAIADFTNPGVLGTFGAFRHVYEEPILASRKPDASSDEMRLGQNRAAELSRITGMFILRRTQEINNKYLPPRVDLVLFCSLTPLQRRLYSKLLLSRAIRSCLQGGGPGGVTNGSEGSAQHLCCIDALKKLCNHPQLIYADSAAAAALAAAHTRAAASTTGPALYGGLLSLYDGPYFSNPVDVKHSGKLMVLDSLLNYFVKEAPAERVVIMSNYTKTLDLLETLLKRKNYQFLRLDGQTPTAKRMELVDKFNNKHSTYFIFLLSTKAGGVGLNLVGASRLILYDIDWNPANDIQAMARVWRDGQSRRTFVYRLLSAGSIEEKMYQRQVSKQSLSGLVVDSRMAEKEERVGPSFSLEQLKELFTLGEESVLCATHDLLNCYCKDGRQIVSQGNNSSSVTIGGKDAVSPNSVTIGGRESDETEQSGPVVNGTTRNCQLSSTNRPTKSDNKNMAMDELLQWKHVAGPNPNLSLVDPLTPCGLSESVTYVFWTESNTPLVIDTNTAAVGPNSPSATSVSPAPNKTVVNNIIKTSNHETSDKASSTAINVTSPEVSWSGEMGTGTFSNTTEQTAGGPNSNSTSSSGQTANSAASSNTVISPEPAIASPGSKIGQSSGPHIRYSPSKYFEAKNEIRNRRNSSVIGYPESANKPSTLSANSSTLPTKSSDLKLVDPALGINPNRTRDNPSINSRGSRVSPSVSNSSRRGSNELENGKTLNSAITQNSSK